MNGVGIWNEVVKWVADADSNSTDTDRPLGPARFCTGAGLFFCSFFCMLYMCNIRKYISLIYIYNIYVLIYVHILFCECSSLFSMLFEMMTKCNLTVFCITKVRECCGCAAALATRAVET